MVRQGTHTQPWARQWAIFLWLCLAAPSYAQVTVTKENYLGWPNTYVLRNEAMEVRVVTDVGPRILSLARTGGENIFHVRQNEAGKKGESEWVMRGGWRLWVAPERRETTYAPDNQPCTVQVTGRDTVEVTGPPQPGAGIQKIIEVRLVPGKLRVRLRSRIRNISSAPVEYAPWSLAVMRPGGRALVPVDEGPPDALDSVRAYILWSYARMDDPRYRWGSQLIQVDHRKVRPGPPWPGAQRRRDESKIGTNSSQGWAAYAWNDLLFLQRFPHAPGATYPDGGATIEVYSSAEFLELEHLGPITRIEPGQEVSFPEDWWLIADVRIPEDEAGALEALRPWLERTSR
ncbi:MAG: hypothetical protein KatS3mg077_0807 [Candidatus Binatia bacterium]|nr:MAG: hypothetical protein KatS3mg077_0807 [Candidatus Binatia bacterium]